MTIAPKAKTPELLPLAARVKSASITLTVASAAYGVGPFGIANLQVNGRTTNETARWHSILTILDEASAWWEKQLGP